jgi:hypothetical protein
LDRRVRALEEALNLQLFKVDVDTMNKSGQMYVQMKRMLTTKNLNRKLSLLRMQQYKNVGLGVHLCVVEEGAGQSTLDNANGDSYEGLASSIRYVHP